MSSDYDVIIAGGGLVGASLALGLEQAGLQVALVEVHPPTAADAPSYDDRTLALSHASCTILAGIGLWPGLGDGVTPIRQVHVTAAGRLGSVRIEAREMGVEALGHVVEARLIGAAAARLLPERDGIDVFCPARVSGFVDDGEGVAVTVEAGDGEETLRARALVGADGAASPTREALGLGTLRRDYGQTAIIANVTPVRPHAGRAFERFTASGPVALLPHQGRRCGAVWTVPSTRAAELLELDDDAFLAALQAQLGYRLGRLERMGRRSAYPLRLVYAPEAVAGRVAVMGNAAHTIHPVAAQGFNLGLRDVAVLVPALQRAAAGGEPFADALLAYQQGRRRDQGRIVSFTDSLVDLFALDLPLAGHLAGIGLMLTDRIGPLKRALARRTMGYGVSIPGLVPPWAA